MKLLGLSLSFFFISCHSIKWIENKNQGKIENHFYSVYCNDFLKFNFIPDGHVHTVPKSKFYKTVPEKIKKDLVAELKANRKGRLAFVLNNNIMYPSDFYHIGFITKKKAIHLKADTSDYQSIFYKDTVTVLADSFYKIKYQIPLENNNLTILTYEQSSFPNNTKNFNQFYSFDFFSEVTQDHLSNSLKTGKYFNCITPQGFQQYYWDSVNINKGDYLKQIRDLISKKMFFSRPDDLRMFYEFLITHFSFITSLDSVKYYLHEKDSISGNSNRNRLKLVTDTIQQSRWKEAVDPVITLAKQNRVLMFNESHFDWRHRYYVTTLLDTLYKLGYHTIALESLSQYDDSLNIRQYPTQNSGYYLSEPYAANIVRQALRKNFKVIAYEDTMQAGNREYNQAENIYNKIKNDDSKILILAGYDHILKDTSTKKQIMLAGYLCKMFRQCPATVNQTKFADIFYDKNYFTDKPVGYYASLPLAEEPKIADLDIMNNIVNQPYDDTMNIGRNLKYKIQIPIALTKKKNKPRYLFVYIKPEYDAFKEKAIPIYIKAIVDTNETISFNLPKDEYFYIIQNEIGEYLSANSL